MNDDAGVAQLVEQRKNVQPVEFSVALYLKCLYKQGIRNGVYNERLSY